MRFLSPLTREGQGARFRETPRDSRTTPTPFSLSSSSPVAGVCFSLLVTPWPPPLRPKKKSRVWCRRQREGWKRGKRGGERVERNGERERGRGMLRRSSYNFARVGRSRLQPRFHHPLPPSPPLRLCPSVKRNNYYRKNGAHACGKPRRDPELHWY